MIKRLSYGCRASAVQVHGFHLLERRHWMSSALSHDLRRRTGGHSVRVIFSEEQIAERVAGLGAEISEGYPDGGLLVLGLLKGSFIFLSDLVRRIDRPLHVDFLVASSYGAGKVSSGTVRLLYDPETPLAGKHILLVEDIIDSGRTMKCLVELLAARNPDRKSTRLN